MKALRRPTELSKEEQKAMNRAINAQILENSKQYTTDYESMILWVLHKYYGFGKSRLLRFRELFIQEAKELRSYYEMDDVCYPARQHLKDMGVDIEKLNQEDEVND